MLTYFSMPDASEFNMFGMPLTERAREYHSILYSYGWARTASEPEVTPDALDADWVEATELALPSFSNQRERAAARSEFRTKASYRNRGRKRRTFRDLH